MGDRSVRLRVLSTLAAACLAALLCHRPLSAQYTTASLGGTVVDQSGAAVPEAGVTVENTATGFTQKTSTDATGAYLFPRLQVGPYNLRVEKTGFTTYIQKGIILTVNQAASQPVTLQVGTVTQEVTVAATAELVNTREATVGQAVNEQSIVDLPLNGRNAQGLVFLAAGVTNVTEHYCGVNCEGGVYPGEQYASISGAGSNGVNYQLDGVDHNDTYINTNLPFPNPDAVQEFNVQTSNMSAEYGNAVGGVVNVVSKSGTNEIHGDGFEFLRNGALNARNFFAPAQDTLKRNQFGGSVGGPIKKDKLFYFGTYQGTRLRQAPQGNNTFVPTKAERTGDFSDLCPGGFVGGICPPTNGVQLMDPTAATPTPFLNNQIPANRLNAVSQFFLAKIPLPNGGPSNPRLVNFVGPSDKPKDDQFMIKLDYVRGKHQISGRYFFSNFLLQPFTAKDNLLQVDGNGNKVRVQNIDVNYTYNVSSNLLLNAWFGWNQQNGGSLSGAPFGFPDAGVKIAAPTPPELVIGVGGAFGIGTNHLGVFNRGDQTFRENSTWIKGPHEFRFGVEALRIRAPQANTFEQSGEFFFSGALSGDNIADFLLGRATNFTQAGGIFLSFTGIKWSAYANDNWKINNRLTLNLGLRWDPFSPYHDSEGRVPCFLPGHQSQRYPNAPLGLLYGGDNHDPGCPPGSFFSTLGNFAPRVGFAYRLTQDGKTSLRGGVGIYYEPPNTVAFQDVVGIAPFAPIINLIDVDFTDPYGSAGIPNPFPAQYGPRLPASNATFPLPISITQIFDRNFHVSQVATWNLTLERQIAKTWLVRAAYVGNKGTHLFGTGDQESGLVEANPAINGPGATVGNTQQRRLYPNFGFIGLIDSGVNGNYNGFQLTGEKRLSYGLSLLTNFTWAKQLNDFAPVQAFFSNTNPFNRHFDYGRSDDDISHVFKLSAVYQVPHPKLGSTLGRLVEGWELTTNLLWQGGFPFSVFSGMDNSLSGVGEDRADFIGTSLAQAQLSSSRPHSQLIAQWFNTALFKENAIGTFGNTGKNILRGPKLFNTDLGILKNTKVTERTSVQFRAEFFNAFNNVNFDPTSLDSGVPDSGFGQITRARDPRILQFALKLVF